MYAVSPNRLNYGPPCLILPTLSTTTLWKRSPTKASRSKTEQSTTGESAIRSTPIFRRHFKSLLTRSDNMYAEAVLRALALNDTTFATREMAVNCERRILEDWGIDTQSVTIYDGSGLSRANSITPAFLADVLTHMANDEAYGDLFPSLFPVAGENGTVKKLLKNSPLKGKMALKSGSMTGVLCYAGYYPAEHPQYAVVLMTNKYRCSYDALKKAIETLFEGMFADEER